MAYEVVFIHFRLSVTYMLSTNFTVIFSEHLGQVKSQLGNLYYHVNHYDTVKSIDLQKWMD